MPFTRYGLRNRAAMLKVTYFSRQNSLTECAKTVRLVSQQNIISDEPDNPRHCMAVAGWLFKFRKVY